MMLEWQLLSALPTFNNLQAKISGREPKRLLIENG